MRVLEPTSVVAPLLCLTGCGDSLASSSETSLETAAGPKRTVSVSIRNSETDVFTVLLTKGTPYSLSDLQSWANERGAAALDVLKDERLEAVDLRLEVDLEFSLGVRRKILTDPRYRLAAVGTHTLGDTPTARSKIALMSSDDSISITSSYSADHLESSLSKNGLLSLINMCFGHFLKDVASEGYSPNGILFAFQEDDWLPRSPFQYGAHEGMPFRYHQKGNIWRALGELGDLGRPILEAAQESSIPDLVEESESILFSKPLDDPVDMEEIKAFIEADSRRRRGRR